MELTKQLPTKNTDGYKLRWATERVLKLRDKIKELNKRIRRLKKYERYYNWHAKYADYFYKCNNMTDENNIIKRIKAKEKQDKLESDTIGNTTKPIQTDNTHIPKSIYSSVVKPSNPPKKKRKSKLFYYRKFY